ncbi:MBG domain-containing protein [Halopseudomonas oceani]|uniref:beta strand repeat-containing protein n=1 Tax=Halopseudomonas oceani TaxID=1708783 RepID=UPI002AA668B4|nr:MBG domain-containing protein [Halopseudomonas oceani]
MIRSANQPRFAPTALAVAISLISVSLHAAELPTGGNIVGGSGSISQDGNSLNVQQNSDKLITNWDSFDIGAGNTVNFYQPGSNSVALNRVIGEDASAIYGNLNANGKVFLVNPNGVLFGEGAAVNVGALVASTLSLSDQDFNDGNYQFQGDGNNAAVINHGSLNAEQGAVALLGGQVSNHGIIQANQGTVALAAGDKITLDFAGDGLLNVTVDEGTLNALVENHQLVRANGGQVIMTANATNALLQTVVNNTGIVEAQTLDNQSGTIVLKGGFSGGTVNVAGTLDASAPDSGDGGFIDTSGAHVKIAGGTQVTTKANNGSTGEWLIDPTDFTINAGSDALTDSGIGAATLSANLEDSNIRLATVDGGTENGDIYVDAAVTWNADTTLTLNAHNDININAAITAQGANGKVALQYGQATTDGGTADYHINAPINLQSGNNFTTQKGSTGSVINYIVVNDAAALQAMNSDLAANYAVGSNIDLGSISNWQPVGGSDRFTGTFNGLGHTLSNLTIDRSSTDFVGLFGATASGSVIRDIGLVGGSISGRAHVGGLVGVNSGIISNAYATGSVKGSINQVGGLVGFNQSGTINNAYATGSVEGYARIGGLVGFNQSGTISNVYATGSVKGGDRVGGLAGDNEAGTITNAYATGSVKGFGNVGGLVGSNKDGGTVTNSYWNTETSGQASAVGDGSGDGTPGLTTAQMFDAANFSGFDFAGTWANADNQTTPYLRALAGNRVFNKNDLPTGTIDATNRPAHYTVIQNVEQLQAMRNNLAANYLLGNHIDASATPSWNGGAGFVPIGNKANRYTGSFDGLGHVINGLTINRSGEDYIGLFGRTDGDSVIRDIGLVGGSVVGGSYVGGLAGYHYGNISNAYATGSVEGGSYVGGLVGFNQSGTMSNAYATGSVVGSQEVGGLIGSNYFGYINNAYATGSVEGGSYVGGLVGFNQSGTMSNAYATGSVVGSQEVGGLIGSNYFGYINNAYATGSVEGGSYVGGLAGINISGSFIDSYWNTDTSGQTSAVSNGISTGTTGLTSAQMMNTDSFTGWDIDVQGGTGTIWRIYEGYTAPLLRRFLTALEVTGDSATTYNGTDQSGTWSAVGAYDADHIFGQASGGGRNAGSYAVDISGLYSDQQGYDLITTNGTLTISKAQATVTANSGSTTYNGTEQSVSGFTVDGLVNGEEASVLTGVTTSGGKGTNAGSYTLTASGSDGNYELTFVDGTLTINKAQATVTANSGTTTYNGTEQSVSGFTVDGLVNGEDASVLTGVTTSGGKGTNAGTYTLTASGSDGNYELTFVDGALTINKAQATVTANSGTTTYNGTEQSVDGFTADGLVNGEDASVLSGVTTSGGKGTNAGSYTLTASGSDGNYELSFVDGKLTINKAQARVTANSGTTTYNGTEQSVSGFTVDGLVNGEDQSVLTGVTTSGGKGTNAGSYTLTASGTDGNYELTFVDGTLTIERKGITGNISADGKTYDGSTYANTHGTLDGVISGDDLQFNTTGAFANKTAGDGKQVDVSGSLGGGDAGNYVLTTNSSTTANIDRKTITADVHALDKLFDSSLAATLEGVLNGTISGDDVALQLSGLFASLTPGENRVLVDASLTGADAGNYRLIAPSEVIASLLGFAQTDDVQSAVVSQPPQPRRLSAPGEADYLLSIDDDALRLTASGQ